MYIFKTLGHLADTKEKLWNYWKIIEKLCLFIGLNGAEKPNKKEIKRKHKTRTVESVKNMMKLKSKALSKNTTM